MRDEMASDVEVRTYQYLRMGMLAVIVGLGIAIAIEVGAAAGCWQRSISAYYYTPVRAVFVGALLALCLGMITLWGRNPVEDAFLNLAGLLAPVVAFVPTSDANACSVAASETEAVTARSSNAQRSGADIDDVVARTHAAIDNNVQTLLVVVAIGLVLVAVRAKTTGVMERQSDFARTTYRLTWLLALGFLVVGALAFYLAREAFYDRAHFRAALLLFACIVVVVLANSWENQRERLGPWEGGLGKRIGWLLRLFVRDPYGWLAGLMVLSAVGIWAYQAIVGFEHWVLVIEIVLIGLFGVFWLAQTIGRMGERAPGIDEASPAPPPGVTSPGSQATTAISTTPHEQS